MINKKKVQKIEVTKNHIIIDDTQHSLNKINNIDFKEQNKNFRMIALSLCIPVILITFFYPSLYSIGTLVVLTIISIPNRKVYLLYINNMLLPKYHTYDKEHFFKLKEKILNEIKN